MTDYSLHKGRNRTAEEKEADAVLFTPTGGSRGRGANPANMSAAVREKIKNSTVVNKPVDSVPLRGASPSLKDFVSKPSNSSYKSSLDEDIDKAISSKGNGVSSGPRSDFGSRVTIPSKKETPIAAVVKKTTVVKPKESDTSRPKSKYRNGYSEADIDAMIAKADNGKTAAFKEATDAYLAKQNPDAATAEDMNMQSKPDTPSVPMVEDTVGGNAMKKGGMTKRPPKPAKKVPPRKFASGGSTSRTSASKRGDGCATKGHTKGKYL